jgi:tRNA threonylcarbamoyladenosine biosynthesis protein TsaB
LILNIDTSGEYASICLSEEGRVIALSGNATQKDHAAFLHPAIRQIIQDANLPLQSLDAIAVTAGPGSYTGLRVGMSAAKGLCYALNKPLITVGTLEVMAWAAQQQEQPAGDALFCPLIDARRMEVFTAVYNNELEEIVAPTALILDSSSFEAFLSEKTIYFFGSGSAKFATLLQQERAIFINSTANAGHLAVLAYRRWLQQQFSNTAYTAPFYVKEFYTPQRDTTKPNAD